MSPDDTDLVFKVLAHHARRTMLDVVKRSPGCAVSEVEGHIELSRVEVLRHLRVLERAGLITSRKEGRVRRLYVNAVPIQMIHERWTTEWSSFWSSKLTRVKYRIEEGRKGKHGRIEQEGTDHDHTRADDLPDRDRGDQRRHLA